jgi:DNA processing protein
LEAPRSPQPDLFCRSPVPVAPLNDAERLACLRLIRSENVGPATFQALINHFGGAAPALDALPELSRRGGRKRAIRICPVERAERELAQAEHHGMSILFTIEPGYPAPLAAVSHPPPLIYAKGNTELLNQAGIAIVGARKCSAAGASLTRQIATDLGRAGLMVVSGLARGIDGAAHEAALASGTIAVLAGGLDTVYPPEHAGLQERIARVGCLVSEQPPGFVPRGQDFPRRNRIVSGMSYGVLVIEAARRSGTLTTARMAAEQGREVFAVPGHPLDPRAEGTLQLLKSGAQMATCAEDILRELSGIITGLAEARAEPQPDHPPKPGITSPPPIPVTDADQRLVLEALGPAPVSVDNLCRSTGLTARLVQMALLELALAGRIEHHGQNLVSRQMTG